MSARNWRDVRAGAIGSGHITEEGVAGSRRTRDAQEDRPGLREPGCFCCEDADCANGRHCLGFARNGNCCGCGRRTARYWLTLPWNAADDAIVRLWWRLTD